MRLKPTKKPVLRPRASVSALIDHRITPATRSGEANSSSLIQSRPHRNGKKLAPDRSNVSPIHHKTATQALKNNHLERRERVGSDLPEDEEATILAAFDQHFASMSATSTTHFSDWYEIHAHSDGDRLAYERRDS